MDITRTLSLLFLLLFSLDLCTNEGSIISDGHTMRQSLPGLDTNLSTDDPQTTLDDAGEVYRHDYDVANMSVYFADSKITRYINMKFSSEEVFGNLKCKVNATIPNLDKVVRDVFQGELKLLEYEFYFKNRTVNPLLINSTWTYKGNVWDRVAHSHGQTILDLSFNYGILSLMTLSFGVFKMPVELQEWPRGCLTTLSETERIQVMLNLLLRDLDDNGPVRVYEGESVCHQIIKNDSTFAKFTDQCCFKKRTTGEIICTMDIPNMWLALLDALLIIFNVTVFLFGPILCTKLFYAQTLDTHKYLVTLKEPLYKTMCICYDSIDVNVKFKHVLDMRSRKTYFKARAIASKLPTETILPIKLSEYHIDVNYARLLPEDEVPVGVLTCLSKAVFFCKIRDVNAVQDCCEANIFGMLRYNNPSPWINVCYLVGRILLVLMLPLPYYVRLGLYYSFEHGEVMDRLIAAQRVHLPMWYEYRILHYLTPTHPLLITMYVIYFATGLAVAIFASFNRETKFKAIIIKALRDLIRVSWLDAIEMLVKNLLWPFRKMGLFGFLLGIIYWPAMMPVCLITCCFYCIPLLFLSCRLVTHALGLSSQDDHRRANVLPGEMKLLPTGMQLMEADKLISALTMKHVTNNRIVKTLKQLGLMRILLNLVLSFICILSLLSMMAMFTECVTYVLQICIFTMMGIIVNAGKVLKYGTLIFLVLLYSYDCYNNVYKQYLKLNKALFSEIKGRIKDLKEVTSLPSHLQQNVGFKAAEASEQADYEITDDLAKGEPGKLIINDLILFVDNDDFPRVPSKLFEEVCQIRVPGSPGPVYLSLLAATGKFFFIILFLLFVFIVVLSFGEVYKMSGTNQMLATMAGGFMPMVFRNILKPADPDIDMRSVSFQSKLEEVIINFWQTWPMHDFPFDVDEKEEEDSDHGEESDNDSEDEKKKDKKDKDGDKKDKDKMQKKNFGSKFSMDYLTEEETTVNEEELHEKLEKLPPLKPASGEYVDILILLSNPDEPDLFDIDLSHKDEKEVSNQTMRIPLRNGSVYCV